MTKISWIEKKLIENDFSKEKVRDLYSNFLKETTSNSSYESYCKSIRDVYLDVKELSLSDIEEKDSFEIGKNIEKLEVIDNKNEKEITSVSKRIKTLEDLVNECKIDLEKWIINNYEVNKWEVGCKIGEEIVVTPLFQVKAKLLKRILDEVEFPAIQPISINLSKITKIIGEEKNLKKALIIPDSQNGYRKENNHLEPFHDRRCWDLVLQLNNLIKPDTIILTGDNCDLPDWSDKFLKSQEFYFTTQPTIIELGWLIGNLRKDNCQAEMIYLEGNHEARIQKAFLTSMIQAYGLKRFNEDSSYAVTSLPYMLNLEKSNIKYMGPYPHKSEYWINENLVVEHGTTVKQGSGDTVKNILQNTRCSKIVGHIHRSEQASKTVHVKKGSISYTVCSPGTIARLDGVVPSRDGKENWQQGIALIDYETGNGLFKIETIPILDGKLIYRDKIFTGTDEYVNQLEKDTNYKF